MFKRLVVAASVTAVGMLGLVPAANASAPQTSSVSVSLHKPAKIKISKAIDWDAPPAKAITAQRIIDWD